MTWLHRETFSHSITLNELRLRGNICIDRDFLMSTPGQIQNALTACGVGYATLKRLENLENRYEKKFESIENQLQIINEKLDDQRNAKEIMEMKKTVDRILDLLNNKSSLI